VISMHDPVADLNVDTLDQPCNTTLYFRVYDQALDMTVICRSNDIIWGAYGANAVHFSVLQEYIAAAIDIPIGKMYQISNNWHAYTKVLASNPAPRTFDIVPGPCIPLVTVPSEFIADCEQWINPDWYMASYANSWFTSVLRPIRESFMAAKYNHYAAADTAARTIDDDAWAIGMRQWINAKREKYNAR